MPTRIAYLGPVGTYGEQASRALADLEGLSEVSFLPCVGLRAVVECLAQAEADAAVVPVENSVEGGVTATLDALWAGKLEQHHHRPREPCGTANKTRHSADRSPGHTVRLRGNAPPCDKQH